MKEKDDTATSPGTPIGVVATSRKRLLKDTLRYLPSAVFPAIFSIAGISVFTRIFDPLDYGRYALVMAAVAILVVFMSAWIQQSILRYFPRFASQGRESEFGMKLLALLKWISWGFLVLAFSVWFLLGDHFGTYARFFIPGAAVVVLEAVFLALNSVMQARMASQEASSFKVVRSLLRLGLALALVLSVERDVLYLIVAAGAANLLLILPMLLRLDIPLNPGSVMRSLDRSFIGTFLSYGLPMVGWMLCSQILALSDRFIIGAFRSSAEVGIYSASYNLVTMGFGLVSTPFLTACYPIIMNAWERGEKDRIEEIIGGFSRYYLVAVLPIVVFIAAYPRGIVALLLGDAFREGFAVVPLVLCGVALWGLAMIGHKGLEIEERTRVLLGLVGVATVANVVLNLIFVPRYGYVAAAATTLASYALYPVLVLRVTRKSIAWALPWKSVARILAAGAIALLLSQPIRAVLEPRWPVFFVLVAGFGASLVVYVAGLFLLGELKRRSSP